MSTQERNLAFEAFLQQQGEIDFSTLKNVKVKGVMPSTPGSKIPAIPILEGEEERVDLRKELDDQFIEFTETFEGEQYPGRPKKDKRLVLLDAGDREEEFQNWYAGWAKKAGISPDPNPDLHLYDYRKAFLAGVEPKPDEHGEYHWDSKFKYRKELEGVDHPNRFVNGKDTAPLGQWEKAIAERNRLEKGAPAGETIGPISSEHPPLPIDISQMKNFDEFRSKAEPLLKQIDDMTRWAAKNPASFVQASSDALLQKFFHGVLGLDLDAISTWVGQKLGIPYRNKETREAMLKEDIGYVPRKPLEFTEAVAESAGAMTMYGAVLGGFAPLTEAITAPALRYAARVGVNATIASILQTPEAIEYKSRAIPGDDVLIRSAFNKIGTSNQLTPEEKAAWERNNGGPNVGDYIKAHLKQIPGNLLFFGLMDGLFLGVPQLKAILDWEAKYGAEYASRGGKLNTSASYSADEIYTIHMKHRMNLDPASKAELVAQGSKYAEPLTSRETEIIEAIQNAGEGWKMARDRGWIQQPTTKVPPRPQSLWEPGWKTDPDVNVISRAVKPKEAIPTNEIAGVGYVSTRPQFEPPWEQPNVGFKNALPAASGWTPPVQEPVPAPPGKPPIVTPSPPVPESPPVATPGKAPLALPPSPPTAKTPPVAPVPPMMGKRFGTKENIENRRVIDAAIANYDGDMSVDETDLDLARGILEHENMPSIGSPVLQSIQERKGVHKAWAVVDISDKSNLMALTEVSDRLSTYNEANNPVEWPVSITEDNQFVIGGSDPQSLAKTITQLNTDLASGEVPIKVTAGYGTSLEEAEDNFDKLKAPVTTETVSGGEYPRFLADVETASRPLSDIYSRTKPGSERDAAITARMEAGGRLASSLQDGDILEFSENGRFGRNERVVVRVSGKGNYLNYSLGDTGSPMSPKDMAGMLVSGMASNSIDIPPPKIIRKGEVISGGVAPVPTPAVPKVEHAPIYHYTKPENIEKIFDEGFNTKIDALFPWGESRNPLSSKPEKGVLYFTRDPERYKTANVYVGQGKGDKPYSYFDEKTRTNASIPMAMKTVPLKPIEAMFKSNARVLILDSLDKYLEYQGSKKFKGSLRAVVRKAKRSGEWDALEVKHVPGQWEKPGYVSSDGSKDLFNYATGVGGKDDLFVFNRDSLDIPERDIYRQRKRATAYRAAQVKRGRTGMPKNAPKIWRDIMEITGNRGLRPMMTSTGTVAEEWKVNVPNWMKNRAGGSPPDEVSDELIDKYGYNFDTEDMWSLLGQAAKDEGTGVDFGEEESASGMSDYHQEQMLKQMEDDVSLLKNDGESDDAFWNRMQKEARESGFGDGPEASTDYFAAQVDLKRNSLRGNRGGEEPPEMFKLIKAKFKEPETLPEPIPNLDEITVNTQINTNAKPEDGPDYLPTLPGQKRRATYGVDKVRAWYNEGKLKYPNTSYIGDISAREVKQNNDDAMVEALEKGQIKEGLFYFKYGNNYFYATDNGIGMSDDDIADRFLMLHATGKGVMGRFGGMGIAKAVILAPDPTAKWTLHTRDNWFTSEMANKEDVIGTKKMIQGTRIYVKTDNHIFSEKAELYLTTSKNHPKIRMIIEKGTGPEGKGKGEVKDYGLGHDLFKDMKSERTIDIVNDNEMELNYYPVPELNKKGLKDLLNKNIVVRIADAKTGARLTQYIQREYGDFEGCLVVDITPNHPAGTPLYPFTDSRMSLKWDMDKPVDKIRERFIVDKASAMRAGTVSHAKSLVEVSPQWNNIINHLPSTVGYKRLDKVVRDIYKENNISFYDASTDRAFYPLEEYDAFIDEGYDQGYSETPYNALCAIAYDSLLRFASDKLGIGYDRPAFIFSKEIEGMVVGSSWKPGPNGGMVKYNPSTFGDKTATKSPLHLKDELFDILTHEMAHSKYPHGEKFDIYVDQLRKELRDYEHLFLDVAEAVHGKVEPTRFMVRSWTNLKLPSGKIVKVQKKTLDMLGQKQLDFISNTEETNEPRSIWDPEESGKVVRGTGREAGLPEGGGNRRNLGQSGETGYDVDRGRTKLSGPSGDVKPDAEGVGVRQGDPGKLRVQRAFAGKGILPTKKSLPGYHLSSNLESLKGGFEQRQLGISIAATPEATTSSPMLAEPKGTKGMLDVRVNGYGLDYTDLEAKRFIDSLQDDYVAKEGDPPDAAYLNKINTLRQMGVDFVENWNSIGEEIGEIHVLNAGAVSIQKDLPQEHFLISKSPVGRQMRIGDPTKETPFDINDIGEGTGEPLELKRQKDKRPVPKPGVRQPLTPEQKDFIGQEVIRLTKNPYFPKAWVGNTRDEIDENIQNLFIWMMGHYNPAKGPVENLVNKAKGYFYRGRMPIGEHAKELERLKAEYGGIPEIATESGSMTLDLPEESSVFGPESSPSNRFPSVPERPEAKQIEWSRQTEKIEYIFREVSKAAATVEKQSVLFKDLEGKRTSLEKMYYQILKRKLDIGDSYRDIAADLGISHEQVRIIFEERIRPELIKHPQIQEMVRAIDSKMSRLMDPAKVASAMKGQSGAISLDLLVPGAKKLKKFYDKWLSSSRGQSDFVASAQDMSVGAFHSDLFDMAHYSEDYKDWADKQTPAVLEHILKAYTGFITGGTGARDIRNLTGVPQVVKDSLINMRGLTDLATQRMIALGIPGPVAEATMSGPNAGKYIERRYRAFEEKTGWEPTIEERADIKQELMTNPMSGLFTRPMTAEEADKYLDEAIDFIRSRVRTAKDYSEKSKLIDQHNLLHKAHISPAWRKFLGEYTDLYWLAVDGYSRMAHQIANAEFLKNVYDHYGPWSPTNLTGMYTRDINVARMHQDHTGKPDSWLNWKLPNDRKYGAFRNTYVPQHFYTYLTKDVPAMMAEHERFIEYMVTMPYKWVNTIGSLPTGQRNIGGDVLMSIVGNKSVLNPLNLPKYLKAVEIRLGKNGKHFQEFSDLIRGGYTATGFFKTEIPASTRNVLNPQSIKTPKDLIAALFRSTIGVPIDALGELYNLPDQIFRIAGKLINDELGMSPQENIEDINATYPNYEKNPRFVEILKRIPVLGPYISFRVNMIRIAIAQARIGRNEMMSPDVKTKVKGMNRLFWLTMMLAGGYIAKEISKKVWNIDADTSKQLEENLPPWQRNKAYVYYRDKTGRVKMIDGSNVNPFGEIGAGVKSFASLDFGGILEALNFFDSPIFDVVSIAKFKRDPFSGKEYEDFTDQMAALIQLLYVPSSSPIPNLDRLFEGHFGKGAVKAKPGDEVAFSAIDPDTGEEQDYTLNKEGGSIRPGIFTGKQLRTLIEAYNNNPNQYQRIRSLSDGMISFMTGISGGVLDPEAIIYNSMRQKQFEVRDANSRYRDWLKKHQSYSDEDRLKLAEKMLEHVNKVGEEALKLKELYDKIKEDNFKMFKEN